MRVRLRSPGQAALSLVDPHVAVAVPAVDDLMLLGAFPTKERVDELAGDRLGALERFFTMLPSGPDLSHAARASKAVGTTDYPMVRRPPSPRPGLALTGDAATASDAVPAVGCGWAFRRRRMARGHDDPRTARSGQPSGRTARLRAPPSVHRPARPPHPRRRTRSPSQPRPARHPTGRPTRPGHRVTARPLLDAGHPRVPAAQPPHGRRAILVARRAASGGSRWTHR